MTGKDINIQNKKFQCRMPFCQNCTLHAHILANIHKYIYIHTYILIFKKYIKMIDKCTKLVFSTLEPS